jgi:hypothetical protein
MRNWFNMQYIGPATVNFPPPEGKKPDAVHVVQTNLETAHLYRYVLRNLLNYQDIKPAHKSLV